MNILKRSKINSLTPKPIFIDKFTSNLDMKLSEALDFSKFLPKKTEKTEKAESGVEQRELPDPRSGSPLGSELKKNPFEYEFEGIKQQYYLGPEKDGVQEIYADDGVFVKAGVLIHPEATEEVEPHNVLDAFYKNMECKIKDSPTQIIHEMMDCKAPAGIINKILDAFNAFDKSCL